MENVIKKKKPCEEKKVFTPKWLQKIYLKNVAITLNFKVEDTTKNVKQKRCGMIYLNILNFL